MHVSWVCFAMILFAKSLFSTQILVYIVQLCIKPGGHTNKSRPWSNFGHPGNFMSKMRYCRPCAPLHGGSNDV
jgi:hypothetical protein